MPRFVWQGEQSVPAHADLRLRGWRMVGCQPGLDDLLASQLADCLILIDGRHRASLPWRTPPGDSLRMRELRRWAVMIGVASPCERAALLAVGLGEVLGDEYSLDELSARARRVRATARMLPCARSHGPLRLELLARDGYVGGRRLGLHPREFALAWRLMEAPGQPVDKGTLLREVWHLDHIPETNSLAVHASRLRSKLELCGLPDFIRSAGGGYALAVDDAVPPEPSAQPFLLGSTAPEPGVSTVAPQHWRN